MHTIDDTAVPSMLESRRIPGRRSFSGMAQFYLDHDVPADLAAFLSGAGYPTVPMRHLGTRRSPDSQHLLEAARSARTLVSHNKRDYLLLQDAWIGWSRAWSVDPHHSGMLLFPQISARRMFAAIRDLLAMSPELTNQVYLWTSQKTWEQAT